MKVVKKSNYSCDLHVCFLVESSWNVMAHGDIREWKWRGNWWVEWVASTPDTTSEHGASSITTADTHNSVASSRLKWRPRRFKWTHLFRRKTKSGFCACAITFQTQYTTAFAFDYTHDWKISVQLRLCHSALTEHSFTGSGTSRHRQILWKQWSITLSLYMDWTLTAM